MPVLFCGISRTHSQIPTMFLEHPLNKLVAQLILNGSELVPNALPAGVGRSDTSGDDSIIQSEDGFLGKVLDLV